MEISAVNRMVGWNPFASGRKVSSLLRPCDHFMSMMSINFSHENGLILTESSNCFSKRPMDMLAYAGAIFVPKVVP